MKGQTTMSDKPVLRTATGVRDSLVRMAAPAAAVDRAPGGVYPADVALRADTDGETDGDGGSPGTIVGYPIVFDRWTEINSWFEGRFLERIDAAAVDATLARRATRVKVQFNHGMDPQIGDKPLGKPRVQQPDDTGMWAETPMSDTSYNRDLAALIADGAIDGQSFQFSVRDEDWVSYGDDDERPDYNPDGLDERTITRLDLYEHGPVTFPAYEATTLGLRSATEVAEWRSGDPAKREVLVALVAERSGLRDIDPQQVIQRDLNGSLAVVDGPSQPDAAAATSGGDDDSEPRRTEDPRSPGRTTKRTAHRAQADVLARHAARLGAAYRETPNHA